MLRAWFTNITKNWLVKRFPPNREVTLNRHNIFIMPTGFGVCYGISCILLFLLGTNYQNNLIILLSMLLISVFVSTMLLSFQNISGLTVRQLTQRELFARAPMLISCLLLSEKKRYGIKLSLDKHQVDVTQINDERAIDLPLTSLSRGVHRIERITISSDYPLGLYRTWSQVDLAIDLTVFPQPIAAKNCQYDHTEQGEYAAKQLLGQGENFHGLSEYQQGESLRRVAWKQVAQGRGMLTKQFSQGVSESQWLDFSDLPAGDNETKLSQLCYLVLELSKSNQPFGLALPNKKLAVGHGENQRIKALNMLAGFRGRYD